MADIEWFVVRDDEGLARLQGEWRRLAATSTDPAMFETYDWDRIWWRTLGRGRTLHVVGARRGGELVALAPLCTKRVSGGIRVREFLGTEEADQGRLLFAPGQEALGPDLTRVAIEDR